MRRCLYALSLVLASGCLPTRDNAHDPENLPSAALQIIAKAPPAEGCQEDPGVEFNVGHSFPRSWCIYLDATGTSGKDIGISITSESGVLEEEIPLEGTRIALLGSAVRFTLAVGEPNLVTVHARNGGGGTKTATQPLVLLNDPPVAIAGPSVTLPVNGYPWTPLVEFEVPFTDGASYDPEGDALEYCWRFQGPGEADPDEVLCSIDKDDPLFTRTVPVTAGITRGILTVRDGAAESAPSTFEVFVGDPILWATGLSPGKPALVDGERRMLRETISGERRVRWASHFAVPGAPRRVAVLERRIVANQDWIVLLDDRTPAVEGEVMVGPHLANDATLAADEAHGRLWTMRNDFSNDQYLVDAFDVTDPGSGPPAFDKPFGTAIPFPYSLEGSDDLFTTPKVDETGALWFVPPFLDFVARVQYDGTYDTLEFPQRRVGCASPRPGGTQTWVADSPDFLNDQTGASRLARYDSPAATTPSKTWSFPGQFLHSINWISEDQFWIADSSLGVLLLDAAKLEADFSIEESTIAQAPELVAVIYMTADPVTGEAFVTDVFGIGTHRIAVDGSVESFDYAALPLFRDEYGALWQITNDESLIRSRYLDPSGLVTRLGVFSNELPSVDPVTGGIFTYVQFPASVQHLAPDGRHLAIYETVRRDGQNVTLGNVRQVRSSFDGTWSVARLYGSPELSWLDFSTNPPTQTLLSDPSSGFLLAARPSSPANATPFIWTLTSNGDVYQVPLTPGPLPPPVHSFPDRARGPNVMAQIAPSMESGSLCLITVGDDADPATGPSTVKLTRIAADGTVTPLLTTSSAPSTYLEIGTASTGTGTSQACWIVLSDTRAGMENTVLAGIIDGPGFVNGVFVDGNRTVKSFAATTNDTIWMTLIDPATDEARIVRGDWDPVAVAWTTTEFDVLPEKLWLSAPNSTIVNGGNDEFNASP